MRTRAPLFIVLSDTELEEAKEVAIQRYGESRRLNIKDRACKELEPDICGAQGEAAFCKGLGHKWEKSVNTFKKPDVAPDIQVRMAKCRAQFPPMDFGNMLIKDNDNLSYRYVLVTGNAPNFSIKGWIWGSDIESKLIQTEDGLPCVPWRDLNPDLSSLYAIKKLTPRQEYWLKPGDDTLRAALDTCEWNKGIIKGHGNNFLPNHEVVEGRDT